MPGGCPQKTARWDTLMLQVAAVVASAAMAGRFTWHASPVGGLLLIAPGTLPAMPEAAY